MVFHFGFPSLYRISLQDILNKIKATLSTTLNNDKCYNQNPHQNIRMVVTMPKFIQVLGIRGIGHPFPQRPGFPSKYDAGKLEIENVGTLGEVGESSSGTVAFILV